MELNEDESWIFSPGAYWASDSELKLTIFRERFMTSFWAGEGLFWYQTGAHGKGKIVLATQGPIEEMTLNNGRIVVDGNYVVGRTTGIKFSIRRAARSYLSQRLSGEAYARVYLPGDGQGAAVQHPILAVPHQGGEFKDPILAD